MTFTTGFNALSHFFDAHEVFLTLIAAAIGGTLALTRYWSDQAWKKKQFAYDYAQKVFDDRKAMTVLRMLDWTDGSIPQDIAKDYELDEDDRYWGQAEVVAALRVHDQDPDDPTLGGYSDKEYVIRELFDACLGHFERLGHFMKTGVITKSDFPTTLAYYAEIMNEARLEPIRAPLFRYMRRYSFDNACYVFEALGRAAPSRLPYA
jgi:hypothetical protein